ncbi:MAG: glycosyltransferase family 39 protein [Sorangiineae bacterium]|nr:glycosyltransferase family 39 protein [Polyangiaceae bacterium]MEB2321805.1 glycosyltransferase family 39 protein [Sorangiineae bacterium]
MEGLPPADRRVERVARVIAGAAVVWFAVAVSWQIAGPFGAGHVAATAARGIMAENMQQWSLWAPVRSYTLTAPDPSLYYAHHPWGIFWLTKLIYELFGRHDFVCRLAPVLESVGTALLSYGLGRALWGPVAGALAACAYVVLPITLSFANFNGFEVPLVFGMMLTTWGYVRFAQTWRRRFMMVSLVGLAFTVNTDWESLVFAGFLLGVLMVTGLLAPVRWFGGVDARRFGQWWMLGTSIAVGTVVGYLALFHLYGALPDLFAQSEHRSSGNASPLAAVLESRSYWIELMFTPPAILVGKLGVVLLGLRVLLRRRVLELLPFGMLAAATFEYVYFKQGADIHIYWPLPFAPMFALGLAVLAVSLEETARWLVARLGRREPGVWLPFTLLGALSLIPFSMVRDAVTIYAYGRDTGNRFDEGGRVVYQDLDKHASLAWIHDRLEGQSRVDLDSNMHYDWSQEWTLGRPLRMVARVPSGPGPAPSRYYVTDARMLGAKDQRAMVERFHVQAVGPIWFVAYDDAAAPLDALALETEKPSLWQWYLRHGNDPIYRVTPSALRTWELRYHFDQPGEPPVGPPARTLEELRILHNAALAREDTARAEALERELEQRLDVRPAADFTDGTRLLGVSFDPTARCLAILFKASETPPASATFGVLSYVEKPMPWSLVPPDPKARVVGARFELGPALWKPGFIYAAEMEVRPRPGTESWYGAWRGAGAPRPSGGASRILLLTVR